MTKASLHLPCGWLVLPAARLVLTPVILLLQIFFQWMLYFTRSKRVKGTFVR